ncbi:ycaO protein [Streptomyces bingchenggensis BCW-1]|uniref:YcaO protein n=1 Tax=Streptomyces bingchenggensis (strain BCW-1) TaxID=749414 RepID=D7C0B0_STRBB|nr:ycaO protein [Streptomyces bingchenggensis BCW-1]
MRREWTHHPFATSTNGLASGNSTAEAALHALYEVIERDAVARLTTLPRAERPRLDLPSVDDPDCAELLDRFGAAGVSVTAFDATWPPGEGGTGVPCYHVSVWSPDLPVVVPGSGCHGAPEVALARALTEAAQGRLTVISGSRDDLSDRLYALQADPAKGAPRLAPSLRTVPLRPRETGHDLAEESRTVAAGVTTLTGTEPVLVEPGRPAGDARVCGGPGPRLLLGPRRTARRPDAGTAARDPGLGVRPADRGPGPAAQPRAEPARLSRLPGLLRPAAHLLHGALGHRSVRQRDPVLPLARLKTVEPFALRERELQR